MIQYALLHSPNKWPLGLLECLSKVKQVIEKDQTSIYNMQSRTVTTLTLKRLN